VVGPDHGRSDRPQGAVRPAAQGGQTGVKGRSDRSQWGFVTADSEELREEDLAEERSDREEEAVRPVFARMSASTRFDVTKFDGTGNFALWQTRVKDLLAQQGCLRVIKSNAEKPAKMTADDWEDLKIKGAGTIRLCLSDQIMYHVMDLESPHEI